MTAYRTGRFARGQLAGQQGGRLLIRPYEGQDWADVWAILEEIFRAGETYAFALDISEEDARNAWTSSPKEVFVATDPGIGDVLGTYYLRPNYDGPGAHVCNCGYAVAAKARGRGVASTMCEHSQAEATSRGFLAMQFNLVASSNEGAVRLWKRMGFHIVGILPNSFHHPDLGFVDAYVMFKRLPSTESSEHADGLPSR